MVDHKIPIRASKTQGSKSKWRLPTAKLNTIKTQVVQIGVK